LSTHNVRSVTTELIYAAISEPTRLTRPRRSSFRRELTRRPAHALPAHPNLVRVHHTADTGNHNRPIAATSGSHRIIRERRPELHDCIGIPLSHCYSLYTHGARCTVHGAPQPTVTTWRGHLPEGVQLPASTDGCGAHRFKGSPARVSVHFGRPGHTRPVSGELCSDSGCTEQLSRSVDHLSRRRFRRVP
jgi:hypothetical protein